MFLSQVPMRLVYISSIFIVTFFTSCKTDNKINSFQLEELQKRELDSVKELLSLSRLFYKNGDFENAITKLEYLTNNFGTYEEVLEAYDLLEHSKIQRITTRITNATKLDTVVLIIQNNINPDIAAVANDKIEALINSTEDVSELKDYLKQDEVKYHNTLAENKIKILEELKKQNAYASALKNRSVLEWKKFLNDYPDYPNRNEIEKTIIALEVEQIFNGQYGEIPNSQLSGKRNNVRSVIKIKNDTKHTLTLRYSGPDIKKYNIPPYLSETIYLKSGYYKVTASVDSYNVRNFAGQEGLFGEYSSSYYIASSRY